ncbi:hypothetical protein [Nocardioides sp.]|uniref:hypothetical protein n=1 Tax=Nocardioides sp. TaxID=35761 RepID=UPI003514BC72
MSYGVLASKSATVMVESLPGSGSSSGPGTASDAVLDRFRAAWGSAWVPARLTLTRLHLNLIPTRAVPGLAMVDLDLPDIVRVELSGARLSKEIGVVLAAHRLQVRVVGASTLAQLIASTAEAARTAPRAARPRPSAPSAPGGAVAQPPRAPGTPGTPGTPGAPGAPRPAEPSGRATPGPARGGGRHVPAWLRTPVEEHSSVRGGW